MGTGRNKAVTLLLAGTLALGMATSSSADLRSVSDSDDSDGALDLMAVEHDHETDASTGQQLLVHRLSMYEEWRNEVFAQDFISNNLSIYFVNVEPAGKRRTLVIGTESDGSLYAEMRGSGGSVQGYARVWRIDEQTVAVAFPKRLLRRGLKSYGWWAWAVTPGDCGPEPVPGCPPDIDRAPDEGEIRHDI